MAGVQREAEKNGAGQMRGIVEHTAENSAVTQTRGLPQLPAQWGISAVNWTKEVQEGFRSYANIGVNQPKGSRIRQMLSKLISGVKIQDVLRSK